MSAAMIAAALGDARREGRNWRCRCPLHGGHSLTLRDGDAGRVLATCWAGCDRLDVLAELRHRGLLGGRADYRPRVTTPGRDDRDQDARRIARARRIWDATLPGARSPVARYLAGRGIELDPWPASLRWHPRCPRPKDDAGNLLPPQPAMVALVEHVTRGPVAVHATYLKPDGSGKAVIHKPKVMFGPVAGGAVRFGMPRAGQWFAVAEGIESLLSISVACAVPGWAALSAGGIRSLILPVDAARVVICADHDASGTGQRAAHDAAARWLSEGRRVRIAMPSEPDSDMADLLGA
jgi:hypothetical protein